MLQDGGIYMNKQKKSCEGDNPRQIPPGYDASQFPKASIAVDNVVFSIGEEENENPRKLPNKFLKVLLIRRKDHPYKDWWGLPGGFLRVATLDRQGQSPQAEETLELAAARELKEETGLENAHSELLGVWSKSDRDPRDRVISVTYLMLVPADRQALMAGTDASEVCWFKIGYSALSVENKGDVGQKRNMELTLVQNDRTLAGGKYCVETCIFSQVPTIASQDSPMGIAFDHGEIIVRALEQLRSLAEDTAILFQLAPAVFTLTELQHMYEAVLQRKLIGPNFRRAVQDFVSPVEVSAAFKSEPRRHRSPQYFKFVPESFQRVRLS